MMNDEIADLNLESRFQTAQDMPDDARSSSMILSDEIADQTIERRCHTAQKRHDDQVPAAGGPRPPLKPVLMRHSSKAKARPPAPEPKHMSKRMLPQALRPGQVQPALPPPQRPGLVPPPAQRRRLWCD